MMDINQVSDYYTKMINVPTKEFEKLEKNAEKIRYCYQRLQKAKLIDDTDISIKDENLAIQARNQGNNFFAKDKDYVRALEQYNKSICLSPSGSENIGICYANRSAIYFQSGLFKFCLQNIELAFTHNYPDRLHSKLENRKKDCLELLNKKNDNYEKFNKEKIPLKLSYPANKTIPIIIDGLELKTSEEFGRHICTKRDLYPGDFVMIDKPFTKLLDNNSTYIKCNNCHNSEFLNLFPCAHCTKVMYCGNLCEQEAWKRFHQYECKVDTEENPFVIRTALIVFTLFQDKAKLKTLIESLKEKPITAFDLNFNDATEEDIFKVIYCLETNASKRSHVDTFTRSNLLALSWHSLLRNPKFIQLVADDEDLFLDNLLHISQLAATNSHDLIHMPKTPDNKKETEKPYSPQSFGTGLFPIISLLNHSCAPNVCRIQCNEKIGIMVLRNIKRGDQLFDSYKTAHTHNSLEERQKILSDYQFECKCEACLGDYPVMTALRIEHIPEFHEVAVLFSRLYEYDPKWSLEYFEKSKKFLKKFSHPYPCLEICGAISVLFFHAFVLYANTPLELQLKPDTNTK